MNPIFTKFISTPTVRILISFFLTTFLLTLTVEAQEKKKPARKVEIWSYLERLGEKEKSDNTIKSLRSTNLGAKRVATVSRLDTNNFEVTVWELQDDGSVKSLATVPGGTTTQAAIAAMADKPELVDPDVNELKPMGHRFVTATRTEADSLRLTVWDVDPSGKTIIPGKSADALNSIRGEIAVATFGRGLVVTAVRDASDLLTLVSWQISEDGSVQQLQTIQGEKVGQIALATYDSYPPERRVSKGEKEKLQLRTAHFASAVTITGRKISGTLTNKSPGSLKVIAWSIDKAGSFTRLGEVLSNTVKDVAASTLSYRRIVTAAQNADNQLEVRTWDFDEQGKPFQHSSAHDDEISDIDVTTLNATRVITVALNPLGYLKLKVWDATDEVIYLGDAQAAIADSVSIVPLGSDWIMTPVTTSSKRLKVIAWMEHGVSLLRSEWDPSFSKLTLVPKDDISVPTAVDDDQDLRMRDDTAGSQDREPEPSGNQNPGGPAPPVSIAFEPEIEGVDPMIAVGFNYIIVSQQTRFGFYNKKGEKLKDKDGNWYFETDSFFNSFLKGESNGSRNDHCINHHTQFQPFVSTTYPPAGNNDPNTEGSDDFPLPPGIHEFYDTRVHFDATSRRFFIFAPARSCKYVKGDKCGSNSDMNTNKRDNVRNRRYWAFAVSKTEDPRDGFYQWMSTEAYVADAPAFTVNKGVIVISKDVSDLPYQPFGIKPIVYVLSVDDLVKGNRHPRSHKFFKKDFREYAGLEVIPVSHYGESDGRTFLTQSTCPDRDGDTCTGPNFFVYSFKNPSDWKNFPKVDMTSTSIVTPNGTILYATEDLQRRFFPPTFRNGRLYYSWLKVVEQSSGKNLFAVRMFRLPLKSLATNPWASTKKADGYLYHLFGTNATGDDAPDDKVSYEEPTITVNRDGHMVIMFCRVGYDTKNTLYPEARYSVYYNDERAVTVSRLLKGGTGPQPSLNPEAYLHYQTAVVDPADDLTVWLISEFSKNGSYRTIVGKVKP